jgi:hypothetical protein
MQRSKLGCSTPTNFTLQTTMPLQIGQIKRNL